jgi:hypothetical protein
MEGRSTPEHKCSTAFRIAAAAAMGFTLRGYAW